MGSAESPLTLLSAATTADGVKSALTHNQTIAALKGIPASRIHHNAAKDLCAHFVGKGDPWTSKTARGVLYANDHAKCGGATPEVSGAWDIRTPCTGAKGVDYLDTQLEANVCYYVANDNNYKTIADRVKKWTLLGTLDPTTVREKIAVCQRFAYTSGEFHDNGAPKYAPGCYREDSTGLKCPENKVYFQTTNASGTTGHFCSAKR